jgi:hypothetical protein
MRYRREDADGDYTFGSGDDTWLINSPEAVAQAVKTRFELWYGQWFLDTTEGTPWIQSVLGKQKPEKTANRKMIPLIAHPLCKADCVYRSAAPRASHIISMYHAWPLVSPVYIIPRTI